LTSVDMTETGNTKIVTYCSKSDRNALKSLEGLKRIAEIDGTASPVIGMPDLCPIQGGFPNGGTFLSEKYIIPATIGMDINCGFSFLQTDLPVTSFYKKKLKEKRIHKLFDSVENHIPVFKQRSRDRLEDIRIEEILEKGVAGLPSSYTNLKDSDQIDNAGSLDGEVNFDPEIIKLARHQLPTIGGGNHFIDFLYLDEVFDDDLANHLELKPKKVFILIHTGSKGVGFEVNKLINAKMKSSPDVVNVAGFMAIPAGLPLAGEYIKAFNAAANYAYASRAVLRHKLKLALAEFCGNDVELKLIRDNGHNMIENHGSGYLHRKGTQRILPADHDNLEGSFKLAGTPAIIPGSMATPVYLVVPTDKIAETFYSINHGSGRKIKRETASRKHDRKKFEQDTQNIVLNITNSDFAKEEAPANYKDIETSISVIEDASLVKKVARFKPFAVMIKGKK